MQECVPRVDTPLFEFLHGCTHDLVEPVFGVVLGEPAGEAHGDVPDGLVPFGNGRIYLRPALIPLPLQLLFLGGEEFTT